MAAAHAVGGKFEFWNQRYPSKAKTGRGSRRRLARRTVAPSTANHVDVNGPDVAAKRPRLLVGGAAQSQSWRRLGVSRAVGRRRLDTTEMSAQLLRHVERVAAVHT